jgi:hypothetical protein
VTKKIVGVFITFSSPLQYMCSVVLTVQVPILPDSSISMAAGLALLRPFVPSRQLAGAGSRRSPFLSVDGQPHHAPAAASLQRHVAHVVLSTNGQLGLVHSAPRFCQALSLCDLPVASGGEVRLAGPAALADWANVRCRSGWRPAQLKIRSRDMTEGTEGLVSGFDTV